MNLSDAFPFEGKRNDDRVVRPIAAAGSGGVSFLLQIDDQSVDAVREKLAATVEGFEVWHDCCPWCSLLLEISNTTHKPTQAESYIGHKKNQRRLSIE